jgi:hypothetical protein
VNRTVALAILAAALLNTAVGAALIRWASGRKFWWLNGFGLFFRAAVVFGGAHGLHRRGATAAQLVMYIVTVAIVQMVGQIYFLEKSRKEDKE